MACACATRPAFAPRVLARARRPPKWCMSTPVRRTAAPSGPAEDATTTTYVWYASFGSNILAERFNCYLAGGRVEGMVRDMPGSRDPTPPSHWARWDDVPYRMFFAHSSPTWGGGGVAFVDVDAPSPANLGTTFRLYRVTLQQYNDVLAQENGMLPGDPACRELIPEEAAELARAWTNLLEDDARDGGNGADPVPASVHAGTLPARGSSTNSNQDRTPPAEMRAPSERWYGYVKCIGTHEGEPVLTFTCDAEELGRFRDGSLGSNPPSVAYRDVIAKGLAQTGVSTEEAERYLDRRVREPLTREREGTAAR